MPFIHRAGRPRHAEQRAFDRRTHERTLPLQGQQAVGDVALGFHDELFGVGCFDSLCCGLCRCEDVDCKDSSLSRQAYEEKFFNRSFRQRHTSSPAALPKVGKAARTARTDLQDGRRRPRHHQDMSSRSSSIVHVAWRTGMRQAVPLSIGVAAYGLVWGALAGQAGLAASEVALMSAVVFAGTAQFVALNFWLESAHALPLGAVVVTTLVVNLRFVLMSASLQPLFERETVRHRYLKAFLISDENWALTAAEVSKGRGSVGFLLGAGAVIYAAWVSSSVAGRWLGGWIADPRRFGLDFAFTATFLALLLGMWKGRQTLWPWAVAAVAAVLAHAWLPGKWYIVVGGLCGSIVAACMPATHVEQ